jgi:predicted AlkP superfamily phosphohydrolase/phosphomutase
MDKKLVILGIDGMDSILVEKFINDMPVFANNKRLSPRYKFKSIFPPDSTPAWASFYLGLNPAMHGIINFVNPGDKAGKIKIENIRDEVFKGKTFWDIAGKNGISSIILLPLNIYPGWEINGTMICRPQRIRSKKDGLLFNPNYNNEEIPLLEELYLLDDYIALKDLSYLEDLCKKRLIAEAKLAATMLRKSDWNIFFIYFSSLDGIQHYFWNYYDETHPKYPGKTGYEDVIKSFYILMDNIVGEILDIIGKDVPIVILSDHGHGARPTTIVNINEILKQAGYLVSFNKSHAISRPFYNTKIIKKILISYIKRFGINDIVMRIAKKFPIWKKIFTSPAAINWNETKAYVTDLSAIKSYSYGGIRINEEIVQKEEKDSIIKEIIELMVGLKDPRTSKKIAKTVIRREELYKGHYIYKYPEIILELDDQYGIGWDINGPIFDYGYFHNIQPGCHKRESPILYTLNLETNNSSEISLMDFAPTILKYFKIEMDYSYFSGRSFLNK